MAKKVTSTKTSKKKISKVSSDLAKSVGIKEKGTSEDAYRRRLRNIIKAQARDPAPLALSIEMAASALHWWSKAKGEIRQLVTYTVIDVSKYGEKIKKHPLFEVATMAMDEARANLKMLGLTFKDVVNFDRDALTEFDQYLDQE